MFFRKKKTQLKQQTEPAAELETAAAKGEVPVETDKEAALGKKVNSLAAAELDSLTKELETASRAAAETGQTQPATAPHAADAAGEASEGSASEKTASSPESVDTGNPGLEAATGKTASALETSLPEKLLQGPFSVGEAPRDELTYISFGALRIPLIPGMQVMPVPANPDTPETVVGLEILVENVGLQLCAYASARSGGYWSEHLSGTQTLLEQEGFKVFSVPTPFGDGLFARSKEHMPMLIWGAEKDRWLLRGIFRGLAAEKAPARKMLELIFHATEVERGREPLAPGDPLILTIPEEIKAQSHEDKAASAAE